VGQVTNLPPGRRLESLRYTGSRCATRRCTRAGGRRSRRFWTRPG